MMRNYAPLVSIVVITYNSSEYVLEALNSILIQSYHNLELIIADDCSSDGTVEICRNWIQNEGQTLQRIELIAAEENTGIPGNCNRGVNQCKGEWIKIIAGDDCLLPHCIEEFLNYANQNIATSIIYSEAELINGKGEVLATQDNYYKSDIPGWRSYFFNLSEKEQLKHYAREPFFLVTPSLFVKRKVLNEIGGFD